MSCAPFFKIVATVLCAAALTCAPSSSGAGDRRGGTYRPKKDAEVDALAEVIASEVKKNGWNGDEFVCLSVNGLDPSPKLVKSLQQRKLRVRSQREWAKRFNCGFELQLEYPPLDSSENLRVHSRVMDLREINTGQGDLALLEKEGEYLLAKADKEWVMNGYVPIPLTSWHKLDAGPFSIFAPEGWKFHQLTGVDSYVGEFVGDELTLTFDFGDYSEGYLKKAKEPSYVVAHKSIGGFSAVIASPRTPGKGITGIYFRSAGYSSGLCVFAKDLSFQQQVLALKIFETIRIGGPMPRYILPQPPPSRNPA